MTESRVTQPEALRAALVSIAALETDALTERARSNRLYQAASVARAALQAQGALQAAPEPVTLPKGFGLVTRNDLRNLVDHVWNEAKESQEVPGTPEADRMIDHALGDDIIAAVSGAIPRAAIGATPEPPGWKLVPIVPTAAMLSAAVKATFIQDNPYLEMKRRWNGFLDAAPAGPASIGVPSLLSVGEKS